MRTKPATFMVFIVPLLVGGCGHRAGSLPSLQADRLKADTVVTQELHIPGRTSPTDIRGPLERYLGVPVDQAEAEKWDHQLVESAMAQCMAAAGFRYEPVAFGANDDPNGGYVQALSPNDRARYESVRFRSLDPSAPDSSCEQKASDRVHLLNVLGPEYAPFAAEFDSDPEVVRARVAVQSCLKDSNQEISQPDPVIADSCKAKAHWLDVSTKVNERVQTAFLAQYLTEVNDFLEQRSGIAQDGSETR